jgi:bla regulator protein blaR1
MPHMSAIAPLLLAAAAIAAAQPPQRPAFAVASIKPSQPDARGITLQFLPGGRLVVTNLPLVIIIATAYNLPFQSPRLIGGPTWIRSERFDIEATAEKGAIPAGMSSEARRLKMIAMLQTLLADRFQLAVRRETKEMPVYAVTVAKDGPKLEKAKVEEKDCPEARTADGFACHEFTGGQGRGLHGQAVDISDLVRYVENWAERPVIDRTGLKGLYRIETSPWIPMRVGPLPPPGTKGESGADVADLPTLFTVFSNLGLKLEAQRAPAETFEITHIEHLVGN